MPGNRDELVTVPHLLLIQVSGHVSPPQRGFPGPSEESGTKPLHPDSVLSDGTRFLLLPQTSHTLSRLEQHPHGGPQFCRSEAHLGWLG